MSDCGRGLFGLGVGGGGNNNILVQIGGRTIRRFRAFWCETKGSAPVTQIMNITGDNSKGTQISGSGNTVNM